LCQVFFRLGRWIFDEARGLPIDCKNPQQADTVVVGYRKRFQESSSLVPEKIDVAKMRKSASKAVKKVSKPPTKSSKEEAGAAAAVIAVGKRIAFDRRVVLKNKAKGKTGLDPVIVLDDDINSETEQTEKMSTVNKRSNNLSAANPVVAKAPNPVVASSAMESAQHFPPSMHTHNAAPFGMTNMQGSTMPFGMSNMIMPFAGSNSISSSNCGGGGGNYEHNTRVLQMMQLCSQHKLNLERQNSLRFLTQ